MVSMTVNSGLVFVVCDGGGRVSHLELTVEAWFVVGNVDERTTCKEWELSSRGPVLSTHLAQIYDTKINLDMAFEGRVPCLNVFIALLAVKVACADLEALM